MRTDSLACASRHLVAATLSALAALNAPLSLAQSADRPAVKVGDAWVYTTTTDGGKGAKDVTWTRRVTAVGADGGFDIQVGERVYKLDPSGNYLDTRGTEYNRTTYQFPMRVGAEWSYVARFGAQPPIDQRGQYKVVAWEPLTVPAGTLDCFRVEGKAEAAYKASYQQAIKETYWYCPKVNAIGKLQRETSTFSRDSPSSRETVEQVLTRYTPRG